MDFHQGPDAVTRISGELPEANSVHDTWRDWGDVLRGKHLGGLVAFLLDAGRPLAFISAQILHMGGPIFGSRAENLARLLESESALARFVQNLGEGVDAPSIDLKDGA